MKKKLSYLVSDVCVAQVCSGSICLKRGLLGCQCKQKDHLCDLCCKDGEKGECKPAKDNPGMKELYDRGISPKLFPGAPCDDFKGYCDMYLKCRPVTPVEPLIPTNSKFI